MARYMVAALIVVGLAVGIWWLMASDRPPTTTMPQAGTPTSTTAPATTTFTSAPTSTTSDVSHVVDTVEEAEEILRELWFGWFEGIYNQDEDRIREVVATEEQVGRATLQFGVMEFDRPPTKEALRFESTEILTANGECLVVWTRASGTFREGSIESVHVIRLARDRWKFLSFWQSAADLWEPECEVSLPPS